MADVDVNGNSLELTIEDEKVKAIGNIPVGGGDESVWTDETFNALGDDNGEDILDENDEDIGDEDAETLWATRDGVGFKAERTEADINGNSLELHVNAEGKIDKIGNKYIEGTGEAPVDAYSKEETDALLDGKVDTVSGKGLSSNDYTTADKGKLDNIESGAEVNLIESVKVDGSVLTIDANKAVDIPLASATATDNETVYVTGVVTGQDKQKWDSWRSCNVTIPDETAVRIGQNRYAYVKLGNLLWMTENLREPIGIADTDYKIRDANNLVYQGLYYNRSALFNEDGTQASQFTSLIPNGWRLPTLSDLYSLRVHSGNASYYWYQDRSQETVNGFNATETGSYANDAWGTPTTYWFDMWADGYVNDDPRLIRYIEFYGYNSTVNHDNFIQPYWNPYMSVRLCKTAPVTP